MSSTHFANPALSKRVFSGLFSLLLSAGLFSSATDVNAQTKATPKAKQTLGAGSEPGAKKFEELNHKDFDKSENIDNAWWPLKPGMQWTFDGHVEEDGKKEPHRLVFTVTDLVKVIDGVRSRVIYDTDLTKGKLGEQELAYFAQDKSGNVWHLGQYREVMEGKIFVGGQIWVINNPPAPKRES